MTDNPSVERLAPGVELRRHGEIFELTIKDLARESIDAWVNFIQKEVESRPDGSILFWVQDVSACKLMAITPYMRERMKQMVIDTGKKVPRTIGYNALILPRTVITHIANLFMVSLPSRDKGKRSIFFDRDSAFTWLQNKVAEVEKKKAKTS